MKNWWKYSWQFLIKIRKVFLCLNILQTALTISEEIGGSLDLNTQIRHFIIQLLFLDQRQSLMLTDIQPEFQELQVSTVLPNQLNSFNAIVQRPIQRQNFNIRQFFNDHFKFRIENRRISREIPTRLFHGQGFQIRVFIAEILPGVVAGAIVRGNFEGLEIGEIDLSENHSGAADQVQFCEGSPIVDRLEHCVAVWD